MTYNIAQIKYPIDNDGKKKGNCDLTLEHNILDLNTAFRTLTQFLKTWSDYDFEVRREE